MARVISCFVKAWGRGMHGSHVGRWVWQGVVGVSPVSACAVLLPAPAPAWLRAGRTSSGRLAGRSGTGLSMASRTHNHQHSTQAHLLSSLPLTNIKQWYRHCDGVANLPHCILTSWRHAHPLWWRHHHQEGHVLVELHHLTGVQPQAILVLGEGRGGKEGGKGNSRVWCVH